MSSAVLLYNKGHWITYITPSSVMTDSFALLIDSKLVHQRGLGLDVQGDHLKASTICE